MKTNSGEPYSLSNSPIPPPEAADMASSQPGQAPYGSQGPQGPQLGTQNKKKLVTVALGFFVTLSVALAGLWGYTAWSGAKIVEEFDKEAAALAEHLEATTPLAWDLTPVTPGQAKPFPAETSLNWNKPRQQPQKP